jgi:hypothetical protein
MESPTPNLPKPRRKRPSIVTPETQPASDTDSREIPGSTPSFKSFSHVRNPKARRAQEYEQQLLILRDIFPEFTAGIDEQIAYARAQSKRKSASDRDRVLAALEPEREGLTCAEVAADLEIPYATTYKILKEYLAKGIVAAYERAGRAGNKPYLIYSLVH